MKVIIIFTFCCDKLWKSEAMEKQKPEKLRECFSRTFMATLLHDVFIRHYL